MIYVSKLVEGVLGGLECTLTGDSEKEVDEFAAKLGLRKTEEYKLNRVKRELAIKMGANEKD